MYTPTSYYHDISRRDIIGLLEKKQAQRRSNAALHGTIREDMTSPVNPTRTGHQMVCNLWQGVYYSSPHKHSDVLRQLTYARNENPSRHDDNVCLHHTHYADMIPGVSISYRTALSTSARRLPAHPVSALILYAKEIQALWSQNHDTGSYDALYQVDSSSSDVVIYRTMTGKHYKTNIYDT